MLEKNASFLHIPRYYRKTAYKIHKTRKLLEQREVDNFIVKQFEKWKTDGVSNSATKMNTESVSAQTKRIGSPENSLIESYSDLWSSPCPKEIKGKA
jgi:hypothetical protein